MKHPVKTPPPAPPASFWGSLAVFVLSSERALCGLAFLLALATASALALHEAGINVVPSAVAATEKVSP